MTDALSQTEHEQELLKVQIALANVAVNSAIPARSGEAAQKPATARQPLAPASPGGSA
ncbi:hypothetical protein QO058_01585 [Bosea vestrisii]|uniref:hypothetical protein n=1 Tax=Bosea vestrisii TaxID=151416 RepID=UPI0024DFDABA|nr:hypothetical protein [Bosea vestrisii]WID97004.1 hypothetical protein QO058_01585 [Bosea vestrisii]